MKIIISKKYSRNFIDNNITRIIYDWLKNNTSHIYNYNIYNNYIKSNYNIDIDELIKLCSQNILILEQKNNYKIELNKNIRINNTSIDAIVRFIDYGSSSMKGLNLFNRCARYIERNMQYLYLYYVIKGNKGWQ